MTGPARVHLTAEVGEEGQCLPRTVKYMEERRRYGVPACLWSEPTVLCIHYVPAVAPIDVSHTITHPSPFFFTFLGDLALWAI